MTTWLLSISVYGCEGLQCMCGRFFRYPVNPLLAFSVNLYNIPRPAQWGKTGKGQDGSRIMK